MEQWRNIPGYEELYQISDQGRIKSLKRRIFLRDSLNSKGYPNVKLFKNGEGRMFRVHRLVLNVFVGESNLQCNHKNGIKTDNRFENLEWITNSKNMEHAYRTGIKKAPRGENHSQSKLTEMQVVRIKFIRDNCDVERGYWTQVSKSLNVSKNLISRIVNNKAWSHV